MRRHAYWSDDLLALHPRRRYPPSGAYAMRLELLASALAAAYALGCGGVVADERARGDASAQAEAGLDAPAPPSDGPRPWPDGQCLPDLSSCMMGDQCCTGACVQGQCAAGGRDCLPDGLGCEHPAQCCSLECSGRCGLTQDAAVVDAGGGVDALPATCGVGPTHCDGCLAAACCAQVQTCMSDTLCAKQLQCLTSCEQGGASGFACSAGPCSKPSDQATADLFTCGSQQCASPCYSD